MIQTHKYQSKTTNIRQNPKILDKRPKIFNKSSNKYEFSMTYEIDNIKKTTSIDLKGVTINKSVLARALQGNLLPCLYPYGGPSWGQ